jgi:hypothetical protein
MFLCNVGAKIAPSSQFLSIIYYRVCPVQEPKVRFRVIAESGKVIRKTPIY